MKIVRFFLFIFFLPVFSFAESMADVQLKMDFGRFRYDEQSIYLEIYYSVVASNIKYSNNTAYINLDFALQNAENDSIVATEQIKVNFDLANVQEPDAPQATMGILKSILPEGKFKLHLVHETDSVFDEVSVSSFASEKITLSDLELCSNIITKSQNSQNPFFKNTMEVIPNPALVFGKAQPRLYYYLECYNLNIGEVVAEDETAIQVAIADTDGNVRLKKDYNRKRENESSVEIGAFNVGRLESGLYTLIFAVTDVKNNMSVYRRRNFYIENPDVVFAKAKEAEADFLESIFKSMPEGQLDMMFVQAKYLASKSELNVYNVLNTVESKRQFLFQFWRSREKNKPDWQSEYYARIGEANERFRVGGQKGWESDMGRVFILYGEPDEYERHPQERDSNPYEVWRYHNIEGGVEFDFVDFEGFGTYQLVNSTKRDEISYSNWHEYIMQR